MLVTTMYSRSLEREGSHIKHSMKSSKTRGASSKSKGKKQEKLKSRKEGRTVAPLANTRSMRTSVPQVSGSPYSSDGRVRIRHREFVQDVNGSELFTSTSYSLNPGISATFPWLSIMAKQFESYLFRSLKFDFETQKSASTSGSVMLAVDFDAADAPPSNKQELMSFHNAVRSAVWAECCYSSDLKDLQKFGVQRYIRSSGLSANLDIKTYDVGNLVVATQGEADSSVIGELYVEYDVELITPQLSVSSSGPSAFALNDCTPIDADLMAGSIPDPLNDSSISRLNNVFTFASPGKYLLTYYLAGNAVNGVAATASAGSSVLFEADASGANELTKMVQVSMLAGGTLTLNDTVGVGIGGNLCITFLPSGFGTFVA